MNIEQITLNDVYEFMETGNVKNAPVAVVDYLQMLDKIRGMLVRIDDFGSTESIVKHLILVDGLSRYKAAKLVDETREYFFRDSTVSKNAWRNIYADKMDMMINFSMQIAKDVNDAAKVVKMIVDTVNVRDVNGIEKEVLPEELFQPPFVVYTADAELLGMPKVDRQKLSKMIDKFPELTEKERIHIKREAMVLPVKIFPNEQEDARKS